MASLAPSNATPIEQVLFELASDRLDPITVDLTAYWDPYRCPIDALPHLAHGLGLPIWRETWSEAKKRQLLAEWPVIAAKLGTEDAIRWAVQLADGDLQLITVPPQAFYLAGDPTENTGAWEDWLSSLPEIRLIRDRSTNIETGYPGELDFSDDIAGAGMFLGDEQDVPTFFCGSLMKGERAAMLRDGVETEILFSRRGDPRYGATGEVVDFYWFGTAGAGLFLDDAASSDLFANGAPDIETYATVAFGFGTGSADSWHMIAQTDFVQDVTPRFGEIYDEDDIGLYCDDFWLDQFLDEIDPLRATYQSFRVLETAPDWQPPGSYLDYDRFSMPAYTGELLIALSGTAPPAGLICDASYFDDAHALGLPDTGDVDGLCSAIDIARSHRDQIMIAFPNGPDLSRILTWAEVESLI